MLNRMHCETVILTEDSSSLPLLQLFDGVGLKETKKPRMNHQRDHHHLRTPTWIEFVRGLYIDHFESDVCKNYLTDNDVDL